MNPVYSKSFTVQIHEVNHSATIKISGILNYFQSTASEQSASLGIPVTKLIRQNLTWMVTRYHLRIYRLPKWTETVTVSTWRSGQRKMFAPREFQVVDANNQSVIDATSSFMLVDTRKKKPVSPHDHLPHYPIQDLRILDDPFRSLPELTTVHQCNEFQVRKHDLDINRHVNNTLYVEWALETIPETLFDNYHPKDIKIAFKGEAGFGDVIKAETRHVDQGQTPFFHHRIRNAFTNKTLTLLTSQWERRALEPTGLQ